jgi:hypothetical protein
MKPAQTVVFSIAIRTVCQHRSAYDRGNEGETLEREGMGKSSEPRVGARAEMMELEAS